MPREGGNAVKPTNVSVTYGRKFNLGEFQSAHIEISIWAEVDEEDDLNEAMGQLWSMAKENVRAQALPLIAKQRAKVKEVFLGLPVQLQEEVRTNGH